MFNTREWSPRRWATGVAKAARFPFTELKVDTKAENRGPLLLISGEKDHTIPPAVVGPALLPGEQIEVMR